MRITPTHWALGALALCTAVGVLLLVRAPDGPAARKPSESSDRASAPTSLGEEASPPAIAPRLPNVLLFSIDTLRADAVGAYGSPDAATPTLDRLARDGALFTHAYATSSWTAPSLASLHSGLYPSHHGVTLGAVENQGITGQESLPESVPLLAEKLSQAGYRTFGLTANGHLAARFGFARGFQRYECVGFESGPRVLEQLRAWSQKIVGLPNDPPYFLWVHVFDPHSPYLGFEPYLSKHYAGQPRFPELERVTPADDYERLDVSDLQSERFRYVHALYKSEVAYADVLLRKTLELLSLTEPSPSSLVIVLSDHGEEFLEHGRFGHGHALFEESVRIPLIVRLPSGRDLEPGRSLGMPVSLIDVAPTLLELLGLAPIDAADGQSLASLLLERGPSVPAPRSIALELSRGRVQRAIRQGNLKLIDSVQPKERLLFDLGTDPEERASLLQARMLDADALLEQLEQALSPSRARRPRVESLDRDEIEALKSMGYVQ